MYTANYKYQIKQEVVAVDPKKMQFYKGIVLQNHIDVYKDSKTGEIVTEVTYIIRIVEGHSCTIEKSFAEVDLYATLQEAIAAHKI